MNEALPLGESLAVRWPRPYRIGLWAGLFVLAGACFLLNVEYDPDATIYTTWEIARVGYFLHTQHQFANPFETMPTGPTAHVAPLFPVLLDGLYRVFGEGAMGVFSVDLAEALVLMVQVMLLPLATQALGASMEAGFLAAILACFTLLQLPQSEGNYVAVVLILATLAMCGYLRAVAASGSVSRTAGRAAAWRSSPVLLAGVVGFLWGTALLINPAPALVWPAWLGLGVAYALRRGARLSWLPVLLVPIAMIAPWTARNYAVFHRWIPVRDNFGLELMISNNPCASAVFMVNERSRCFEQGHPNENVEEARKVVELGEVNYNAMKMQQAVGWIRAHPGAFTRLTVVRFLCFWFPVRIIGESTWIVQFWHVKIDLLTLLSLPGLFLLARRSPLGAALCAALLVFFPLTYYVIQFTTRYRFPILWVTCLLAGVAIHHLLTWAFQRFGITVTK